MKEENEITQEVRELLESLEQHGRNARRQKDLSDLIDSLAAGTSLRGASATKQSIVDNGGLPRRSASSAPRNDEKRRRLYPLWWIVGAAAACLLLWLLAKPALKETPNMDEKNLVEETGTKDTIIIPKEVDFIEESVILEEPVPEQLLAEETPVQPAKPKANFQKPTKNENNFEEPLLAENTPSETISMEPIEPTDTSNIGSNTISNLIEENLSPLTSHLSPQSSPQRRVVRSLNLVCYECQKEPENDSKFLILNSQLEKTIFGQPQDPNMKNGSLAFELKLH